MDFMRILMEKKYVTIDYCLTQFSLTKRQFAYRMDKLNDILKQNKLPQVKTGTNNEILISDDIKKFIYKILHDNTKNESYYLNNRERLQYIYLVLFLNLESITMKDLTLYLGVGRSTVFADLKELSRDLRDFDIEILNNRSKGYYLSGSEATIRQYIMKRITYNLEEEGSSRMLDQFISDFNLDIYSNAKNIIKNLSDKHHIRFVQNRLKEFIYVFVFLRERLLNKGTDYDEIDFSITTEKMHSLKEYTFALELLDSFTHKHPYSLYDIHYITSWILGISYGNYSEQTSDRDAISDIVVKIMLRFESLSGTHYVNNEEIFSQLYSHIRPAYYRMLFKIPIQNPLSNKVKKRYSELYNLVAETMRPFSDVFSSDVAEEELAFLTVHFATIYINNPKRSKTHKKTGLIVCNSGIGSSAILYNELLTLFPEIHFLLPVDSSKAFSFQKKVDIIFTTSQVAEFSEYRVPVIKVSPVMTLRERYQVVQEVHTCFGSDYSRKPDIDVIINIVNQYANIHDNKGLHEALSLYFTNFGILQEDSHPSIQLTDILKEEYIQVNVEANDAKDAIYKAYMPLVEDKAVLPRYVDQIIKTIDKHGSYFVITKHVALPHTKKEDGALKLAMGLTVLKTPVNFGSEENDPVKYIFCLSALDNQTHLLAMAQLVELFNSVDFFNLLDHVQSPGEICRFMQLWHV